MKINNLVKNYYLERKCNNKLFPIDKTISIHRIINHNSNIKNDYLNLIVLLNLVRKNKTDLKEYINNLTFDIKNARRYFILKKIGSKLGNDLTMDAKYQTIKKTYYPYE